MWVANTYIISVYSIVFCFAKSSYDENIFSRKTEIWTES